jgi:hypothetical protein
MNLVFFVYVCLMGVVSIVRCYLCLCFVIFQLEATLLLTQQVSKQEFNWIEVNITIVVLRRCLHEASDSGSNMWVV